ncbi:hypothetical protein WJ0W_002673 [Paenibacillus melissococcoides]|uniref:Cation acetate symporter n=1 Tax=Paenibacillus melissococcoides TaxID=2912268 RepID=A0ABM9G1J3_9BACL|nr:MULTISPECIES: hypothetical protein [Paenibacillus]MEB9896919.1 hypothetical protein [Bacillus cereus]CAH8245438.1 hypothetical protein WJ0W_002673 [Paenibacillus melissococcoides]CAH8710946.1 hypothetical protein WDD9_002753 [Paenibacillus melissococcoides]CAH8711747.1 hypothetical protein HTL2_003054 [Paenibacillus melissococcoides]GIO77664.1 hypothetical protein J6TS7_12740 [Paenibacillus dendritiformis]
MSTTAFILFLAIVMLTMVITYIAAKKTRSASDFYTAGGGLKGWQNGLAIAGDYMSAASFLGIAGSIALVGFDGFFYSIGFLVAYLVVLYLVAEPLRNLGKFTLADMIAARFNNMKIRGVAALNTVTISTFYMIAQLVGAGALIKLLLGMDYIWAVLIVGCLMTLYVAFGGIHATSWVQIIKFALISAVAFATILAVVTGLVLSAASAFAHDFYNHILRKGKANEREQMKAARYASIGVAVLSIALALLASKLNVAFLVGLAFAVAASANLPVILFTILWCRFNTAGAISGMLTGLLSAIALVAVSPSIWDPAGKAIFIGAWIGTIVSSRSKDADAKFDEVLVKANTGIHM